MAENLTISNIDIRYITESNWVNASLEEVGLGDTGANIFLQFTIPAATIPSGQHVSSALLYVKSSSLDSKTLSFDGAISASYRFTTSPSIGLEDDVYIAAGSWASIDISNIYNDFAGVESTTYINISSPDPSTIIYTHNADSSNRPYVRVTYEDDPSTNSTIGLYNGSSFTNRIVKKRVSGAWVQCDCYKYNGTSWDKVSTT